MGKLTHFHRSKSFLIDLLQNPIALINAFFLLWNMILILDYNLYSADLECFRNKEIYFSNIMLFLDVGLVAYLSRRSICHVSI